MSAIVKVQNLGKQYRIGKRESAYGSLRESIVQAVRAPFDRLRANNGKGNSETIWALKGVSFEVAQGEVIGIIGRNGAGKSTLLKVLSRITEPTQGRAELYGRVASLLEVGTGFHPELTGRENTYLNGAILGMKKTEIDAKFDQIVAFAELEKFLDTPVKHYSSGMYMRLAFAVASHLEPEILIVDEVLAVGDSYFQKKCLGRMSTVASEGRTVLFVSHNMVAVKTLCSRTIWLDQGQIVAAGETGEVVREYLEKGISATLEQTWDDPRNAPGNEKVRVLAGRVRPLPPREDQTITVETPLELEFEFCNYQSDASLGLTIFLYTVDGTNVFAVNSGLQSRPKGLMRIAARIPGNFLNDGIYTVTIQLVQDDSSTVYVHPQILTFEVLDSVRYGSWFGKWPGVIRPKLEWTSESIDAGSDEERTRAGS